MGITFKHRVAGKILESEALIVAREQARAILAHPCCPKFDLDNQIWTSLGMNSPIGDT
jgi:hypothetical protein